jgi:hypothetical protein
LHTKTPELVVSKAPDEAAALLLRIATLKWQAVTVLASSPHGLTRQDAAAFVADLDGIAATLCGSPPPDVVRAARERVEMLARLRDHEPRRRTAGRP